MARSDTASKTTARDTIVIVAALAVVTVGYLLFRDRQEPPQPPQQASLGGHGSGDMGGEGFLENLPTDYESLVQLGNQQMDARNYAVAAECYRRALAIDGSSLSVRTDFGACLHGMGLPERALEEFDKVLQEDPNHLIATFNKGIVFHNLTQVDSANYWFERVLELDPSQAMADRARELIQ
ncbi:hypothetical protein GF420_03705 [candidate division GN15 bacterium]|nr:hypothetical protein [candidate division GN15 bacterium]